MGIFDIIKKEGMQYLRDAAPGGLLNRELDYAGLRKAGEVASMTPTPLGDMASGLLAVDDLRNKQYGSAALNSIGLLPFIPSMAGHIVYHGSPHKFDKFDMSKIGTGEGAQAYGHGLYFAEAPEVANAYKETLEKGSGNWSFKTGLGETGTSGDAFQAADIAHMMQEYGPVDKDWLGRELGARGLHPNMAKTVKKYLDAGPIERVKGGALYKVDIPDEAIPRMLDWDKPLSEQAPEVQAAFESWKQSKQGQRVIRDLGNASNLTTGRYGKGVTGQDWYSSVYEGFPRGGEAEKVRKYLAKQGIPGIRYLDGMSRGAGQGSSNYVLFDDTLARILEINGQPTGLLPWAEDLAKKAKK